MNKGHKHTVGAVCVNTSVIDAEVSNDPLSKTAGGVCSSETSHWLQRHTGSRLLAWASTEQSQGTPGAAVLHEGRVHRHDDPRSRKPVLPAHSLPAF